MPEGTVKWFNPRKGYGFIANDEGPDIFVHYGSISGEGYKTLVEGDEVNFDVVEGEKGLRAENVVAKSAPSSSTAATSEADATAETEADAEVETDAEDAPDDDASESEEPSEKE